MIGKIFIGLIALFLLLGAFRTPIIDGIKGWRSMDIDPYTEGVVTDNVTTTYDIDLDYDLYQANVGEATVTSNITETLNPPAKAYVEATKVLTVSGLLPSQTRTLTIEYYAETEDPVMRVIGPFLAFFIFFGVAGLIIWSIMSKKGRRR